MTILEYIRVIEGLTTFFTMKASHIVRSKWKLRYRWDLQILQLFKWRTSRIRMNLGCHGSIEWSKMNISHWNLSHLSTTLLSTCIKVYPVTTKHESYKLLYAGFFLVAKASLSPFRIKSNHPTFILRTHLWISFHTDLLNFQLYNIFFIIISLSTYPFSLNCQFKSNLW